MIYTAIMYETHTLEDIEEREYQIDACDPLDDMIAVAHYLARKRHATQPDWRGLVVFSHGRGDEDVIFEIQGLTVTLA